MPQYDARLIREVLDTVKSLSLMTPEERALLFPPRSYVDIIADPPVDYKKSKVVEHRFKGMMRKGSYVPISIRLHSDSSSGTPTHTLTISHTLDVRASPDFATTRTYGVDESYAGEIARLHRAFYESQDARHVHELNKALERRELIPPEYAGAISMRRRRRRVLVAVE